ncbi:rubrerythrin-like domain-containing protein [Halobaculum sp. MBLA0147]
MSERPFVCRECGRRVSAASFRAACPDCGGSLDQESLETVRADLAYQS